MAGATRPKRLGISVCTGEIRLGMTDSGGATGLGCSPLLEASSFVGRGVADGYVGLRVDRYKTKPRHGRIKRFVRSKSDCPNGRQAIPGLEQR